ncbi:MAG TPA: FKBP-type peptidyl-prolyl cis-trans isomerase [Puia sp.]|jgi:FKBP-type peptidyl-prolyl cis-trans isomerase FkpA|nr:FKBP-type peptidyl-prolyl cis-trans isomerase [Puia sp.]
MRKTSLTFLVLAILTFIIAAGCGKSSSSNYTPCTDVAPATDSTALLNFAKANGITPLKDTTGLYYQVITQGSGAAPTDNSLVFITYTGTRMDGTIFDSTTNASKTGWQLRTLIPGWRIGLPKIQAGGHIKLLIPSAYAYGCQGVQNNQGVQVIASNAPLYFDVTLVSIQ